MRLSTLGLLVTLACGFGLWWPPRVTTAQQPGKLYRIGFLSVWSLPAPATPDEHQRPPFFQPFWEAMRQLGWREGQNIVMEERWADTQVERLPALATELVQMQVDLILAAATVETEAAKQATQTIPIVMVNSLDAVNTGLVASLSQPGANVTGITALAWDTWAKRLQLLNETVPGSAPIAILWCTVGPTAGSTASQASRTGPTCSSSPARWASHCNAWRCENPTTMSGPLPPRAARGRKRCSSGHAIWKNKPG